MYLYQKKQIRYVIPASLFLNYGPNRRFVGPCIPVSRFKLLTDSAAPGSHCPSLKIQTVSAVHESLDPLLNSDRFSGPYIPVHSYIPLEKIGSIWRFLDPASPFFEIWTGSVVRGFLPLFLEIWIYLAVRDSLHPSLKIRTDSAVR